MLFAGWEEGGSTSKCCRHGGARKESGKYANCQLKVWREDDEDFTTFLKCGELCKLSRFAENGRNVETIIIMSQINFDNFLKFGEGEWRKYASHTCNLDQIREDVFKIIFLDMMQRLADTERLIVVILIE